MSDTDTTQVNRFSTTIQCHRNGDTWRATEPHGDRDVVGEGDNPREAVVDYVEGLNNE